APAGWRKRCRELVAAGAGAGELVTIMLEGLHEAEPMLYRWDIEGRTMFTVEWLSATNARLVRGAVWAVPEAVPDAAAELLARVARRAVEVHGTEGDPLDTLVANAAIRTLGEL